ncbi:Helix-turn-helix domain protein [Novipirellula aureliae]|uniref:Helix-turn-helix domain protein n=1 Tax=Novipirellula aureliae TaxID=2527966 RepID=A0A5C6E621_9BACT|nr:helix-turn-helix domain-containing protein [Novipirellula aureliae]TWU42936.1 Helix-turn-helix domain protein [Novipirellula aureliae]
MANVDITATVSDDDRALIVADVVAAIRPMIESRHTLLVDGDRLAELLGVSRPTIDRLRADSVIPSVLIGRRRLYNPDAVLAALEERK